MSDDMLIHFSSNSSNQSDQSLPTKIAKLEARMVGKTSSAAAPVVQSQQPVTWSANSKFSTPPENLLNEPLSSDSDDEDVGFPCFGSGKLQFDLQCFTLEPRNN